MLAGMRLKGWRKNADDVIGKPDVIFTIPKIAIFVDGCFWHGCPHCQRKLPEANREYWEKKITRNVQLAKQHNYKLRKDGWSVIRIWEHEINDKPARKNIRRRVHTAINRRKSNEQADGSN
ncbi:MAG: mismatch endonuclease, patch repair protein [Acidobacteriota bacterium]|nr:mismatch endonuclease, patch repair protein [Acidobacteriota bacterium]